MAGDTLRVPMDHPLIDEELWPERYVTGRLDPAERSRFEAHFVDCPPCLDRIEAAEALASGLKAPGAGVKPVPSARSQARPRWALRSRWALVGACAAALLAVLWTTSALRKLQDEVAVERRTSAEARAEVAATRGQLEQERSARQQAQTRLDTQRQAPVRVPVLALLATRGTEAPALELPDAAQPVVLSAEREEPPRFRSYFVSVRSEAGGEVWEGRLQPSSRDAVVLALDSSRFSLGTYILTLEGEDARGRRVPVGRYSFRTVAPAGH